MVAVTHAKVSGKADGADATLVQPSDWDAGHTITGLTTVATDAIWDAAGDLAVGSGADTAVRLAKGNAGGVLAMGNGAVIWNAGTSFPASKATGDRYWRTDLGMEFYWDGTRWLTTTLYHVPLGVGDGTNQFSTSGVASHRWAAWSGDYDIWIVKWHIWTYVGTTNNGSNYWNVKLQKAPADTDLSTFTTASDTVNAYAAHGATVGALLGTSQLGVNVVITKTGAPGPMYVGPSIAYRVVGA